MSYQAWNLTCTWWSFCKGEGPNGATPSSGGIKASFVPDDFIFVLLDMLVALIKLFMLALRPFWPVAVDDESSDDVSIPYWFCCCWVIFIVGVWSTLGFVRFTTSCAIVFNVDIDSLKGSDTEFAWDDASCCCFWFTFVAGPLCICWCCCCWGDMRLEGDVRPLTAADWLLVGDTQLLSELLLLFMWFSIATLLFDIKLLLMLLLCTFWCCDWRTTKKQKTFKIMN